MAANVPGFRMPAPVTELSTRIKVAGPAFESRHRSGGHEHALATGPFGFGDQVADLKRQRALAAATFSAEMLGTMRLTCMDQDSAYGS